MVVSGQGSSCGRQDAETRWALRYLLKAELTEPDREFPVGQGFQRRREQGGLHGGSEGLISE